MGFGGMRRHAGQPSEPKRRRIVVTYSGSGETESWPIQHDELQSRSSTRPPLQRSQFCFRHLRAQPFWDPEAAGNDIAALASELEGEFDAICREVRALLAPLNDEEDEEVEDGKGGGQWAPQGEGLHRGIWLRCELWARGKRHDLNLAKLPVLAAILDGSSALMRDPPGRCYMSLMTLGTVVAPHSGPTNHRLRLHLPLTLPTSPTAPLCIKVGNVSRAWERGKVLLFDDSFEHSVELPSAGSMLQGAVPEPRVLLVADVWHPDAERLVPRDHRSDHEACR